MDYRGWKFRDKVPLIPRDQQWKHYFDSKFDAIDVDVTVDIDTDEIINAIGDKIDETFDGFDDILNTTLDTKLVDVHKHIEDAKSHLCCDICCAKNDIKTHIDNKFNAVNFEEQFSNLNEQAERIIQKLDSL